MHNNFKFFYKIHENFIASNKHIPSCIKNTSLDIYLNIRWQYWVSVESMIPEIVIVTPKGLFVHMVNKLVLGNVAWSHFIFRFFETFCQYLV
jgi:hypothetical protein